MIQIGKFITNSNKKENVLLKFEMKVNKFIKIFEKELVSIKKLLFKKKVKEKKIFHKFLKKKFNGVFKVIN